MLLFFHGKNRSKVAVPFIKWSSRIPAIISWFDVLKQPLNPRIGILWRYGNVWHLDFLFWSQNHFLPNLYWSKKYSTLRRSKDHNKLLLVSPNLQYCENMNRKSFCSRISSSLREVSKFKQLFLLTLAWVIFWHFHFSVTCKVRQSYQMKQLFTLSATFSRSPQYGQYL